MKQPPYIQQVGRYDCSLACLEMALKHFKKDVSQLELKQRVEAEYGSGYKNIWNPTIANLACKFGLKTTLYAHWPLLKNKLLQQAIRKFQTNPEGFDYRRYESPDLYHLVKKAKKWQIFLRWR